jgi:hypothetical protein
MKKTKFLVVVFRVLLVVGFLFSTTVLLRQGSIAGIISADCQILADADYGESGEWSDESEYRDEDEGGFMDEEPEEIPDAGTEDESDEPPLEEGDEEAAPDEHEGDDMG